MCPGDYTDLMDPLAPARGWGWVKIGLSTGSLVSGVELTADDFAVLFCRSNQL